MPLQTPLCDLLGIEHPVMLAGMGGVSFAPLAAAVSEAGGFGTLGMAGRAPQFIREQMREVRRRTTKPFGVDLLAARPETLEAACDIIIEEGAKAFISGLGVPVVIIERLKKGGVLVMNMCGTVAHARKGEEAGVDAVVAQGGEGGGHTGDVAGMALIPQVVDAVQVPVVAAGAIMDGRGLAAALSLGACGVWMGTRFIASKEANAGPMYHQMLIETAETETVRTRSYSGKPMRVRKNEWTADWERRPQDLKPFPLQRDISAAAGGMRALAGELGGLDPRITAFPMGQGVGSVREILPAAEIVRRTVAEAEAVMERIGTLRTKTATKPAVNTAR
jgi:enoyl-[acyl-carrier protein] reductase II